MALRIRKNTSPDVPIGCPLAECMAVLGGAWTPNIIWNLCGGPRRFSELQIDIPKISAKVLSTKLRTLQSQGVVNREVKPTSPPSVEYSLTELGRELFSLSGPGSFRRLYPQVRTLRMAVPIVRT